MNNVSARMISSQISREKDYGGRNEQCIGAPVQTGAGPASTKAGVSDGAATETQAGSVCREGCPVRYVEGHRVRDCNVRIAWHRGCWCISFGRCTLGGHQQCDCGIDYWWHFAGRGRTSGAGSLEDDPPLGQAPCAGFSLGIRLVAEVVSLFKPLGLTVFAFF